MTHIKARIIGITGGIATGKSTVTRFIKDQGYVVIDADKIARGLMKKNSPSYKKTVGHFGEGILDGSGEIDRKALGDIVFSNEDKLQALNSITHPFIFETMKEKIESNIKEKVIFLDIPLLFEEYSEINKYEIYFDEIWLVYTDRDTQIDRLRRRNNLTIDEAVKRIDSQMSIDLKRERSNKVISNLGSVDDLEKSVKVLLENL